MNAPRPAGAPAPMAEAERYQRLRAHLAFLKLPAAAEALPEVLDAARADELSLVAALERLLAVEVEATEVRRLAGRLRFACLPMPWTLALSGVDLDLIGALAGRDAADASVT